MPRDASDWNFDRISTARAQMSAVEDDMMRVLHSGAVPDVVRERMCVHLRSAADDLERLVLSHD